MLDVEISNKYIHQPLIVQMPHSCFLATGFAIVT